MHTYAAGYWPTLLRLRFPASVPVPAAGAAAGRRERRGRRRRRGGVDGPAGRHRPPAHPVRRAGVGRPGQGVGARSSARSPSGCGRRICGAARAAAEGLPTRRGDLMAVRHTENGTTASAGTDSVSVRGVDEDVRRPRRETCSALDGDRPHGRRGRVRLADRPVRLRQVHAAAADRRPRRADGRHASRSSASPRSARAATRTTASRSSRRACCRGARSRPTSRCRSSCTASAAPSARRGSPSSPSWSGSPTSPTGIPTSSPAACSSASRSRGRWPSGRGCCSWTSRSARSTR